MSSPKPLDGVVAMVTGASRGAGKGIACALGAEGATVYVTGRSKNEGDAPLPGTIYATAEAVTSAGGEGIAVACDHADDAQVKALFERVGDERGRINVLVNNATLMHDHLIRDGSFWEKPLDMVDMLNVGLRSSYVSSWYAAPMMVANGGGLIVFTSSFGGRCYMHGPGYGAQKAGVDKFAHDMAVELRPHEVASVSIWMGMLKTDRCRKAIADEPGKYEGAWDVAEHPEFTGRVISAIYKDPRRMEKSGQILIGAEAGLEYGVTDVDGVQPQSHRDMLGGPAQGNPAIIQ